MKNSVKLGLAALALSVSLASCFGSDDKSKNPDSSAATKVHVDSLSVKKVDSAGGDTTIKKTTTTKTTEVKKN